MLLHINLIIAVALIVMLLFYIINPFKFKGAKRLWAALIVLCCMTVFNVFILAISAGIAWLVSNVFLG